MQTFYKGIMPKPLSILLIGACLFVCVNAQNSNRVVLSKDYGVKLCGREFIRAVIFTCGGSRWKRDLDFLLSSESGKFGYLFSDTLLLDDVSLSLDPSFKNMKSHATSDS